MPLVHGARNMAFPHKNDTGSDERSGDGAISLLDELAENFVGRLRQGDHPSIGDYVERHPELASQIRDLFPLLEMLESHPLAEPVTIQGSVEHRDTRFRPGTELCERYEILELVGRGGMGEVYRARDRRLDRDVAVKTLIAHREIDPDALARFQREAKALAALSHPNVLSVHDIGAHLGIPFVIMEFVRGRDLGQYLSSQILSPLHIAELGEEIAAGLAAAHEQGIIHRDIKPHNVFVLDDGRVKVLDFGLARLSCGRGEDESRTITSTGEMPGTVAYMSPEQALNEPIGTASDIFALGIVLYELAARHNPFRCESVYRTMQTIVELTPSPASQHNRDIPSWLDELILRMLDKVPSRRPSASDACNLLRLGRRATVPFNPELASGGPHSRAANESTEANERTPTAPATSTDVLSVQPLGIKLGEFELLSVIGSGGMAVVYRARQVNLGRDVALKCMRSGNDKWELRFRREMHALSTVKHPNLVEIYSAGTADGESFYAMEYIDGADLRAICQSLTSADSDRFDEQTWRSALTLASNAVRERERAIQHHPTIVLDPSSDAPEMRFRESETVRIHQSPAYIQQIVQIILQITDALQALHEAGVVHRDVKPGNIMLTRDGTRAILIDPGIARLLEETDLRLTQTHEVVGTLLYASPEQVLSVGTLDQRSDIYSLGVTLWELLTFRPLFGANRKLTRKELMHCIEVEDPVRLGRYNRGVTSDLEAIVHKCLEKNPIRRYASAADLAKDLRHFLRGEPVNARPIGIVTRSCRTVGRRPLLMYCSAGIVLAAAYGASTLLTRTVEQIADHPTPVDLFTMRIGIKPWIGYVPLIVAHRMGWCDPLKMQLVPVSGFEETRRRLDRGEIDVAMWLVDTHVLARSRGIATKAILKLDSSLEADAVVARREIRRFSDLVGRKVTYQHQEASHFLLLALCEKYGIDPSEIVLQATTAQGAAERFVHEPDIGAAVSYDPHLFNALQSVPGAHRLASGADVPDAVVDILTVREDYLETHRNSVQALLRGWFRAVDILNDRQSPDHAQAVELACRFYDEYAPRPNGAAYRKQDYYEMESGMRYGTLRDNLAFFRVDGDGSQFRRQFSHAQERWGSHHQMGAPTRAEDGDGSAILFEIFGNQDTASRAIAPVHFAAHPVRPKA